MAVRLILGDTDVRYLNQMAGYLREHFAKELEVVSFSDGAAMEAWLQNEAADVALIDPALGLGIQKLFRAGVPAVAYLGENDEAGAIPEDRVVGKYKRPDVFVQIVKELSEDGAARARARMEADRARIAEEERKKAEEERRRQEEEEAERRKAEEFARINSDPVPGETGEQTVLLGGFGSDEGPSARVIAVTAFSGGTGATTVAAALARNLAVRGKDTLYLNLETAGSSGPLFTGQGNGTMDEVILHLKAAGETPTEEILLKNLHRSAEGVCFYAPCQDPTLMLQLSGEDILKLLGALRYAEVFEYIVLDFNFMVSDADLRILDSADRILLVSDGSVTANEKFIRTLQLVNALEQGSGIHVTDRMEILYNGFSSSKSSTELVSPGVAVIGKIPPIKHATTQEIVSFMASNMNVLNRID